MDKFQFSTREATLNYLIGIHENEYTWLNSIKTNSQNSELAVNSARLLALGEALSTKRKGTLSEYFENWYNTFKDYESQEKGSTPGVPSVPAVRKLFGRSPKAAPPPPRQQQTASAPTFVPPFPLDKRVVYLCLCQTVLVMYEAISELSQATWTPEEQQLYSKLDNKIVQHVIMPGIRSLEKETQAVVEKERKLLRFMRG